MKSLENVFFYCLFLFIASVSFAQQITIKGRITDTLSQPISRVSVVASYDREDITILTYTSTKSDGSFTLNFKKDLNHKDLWLSYRHISYRVKKVKYKNKSQEINVVLNEQSNVLEEVILNAKKTVEIKGDTISYRVQGIKKEKDYNIEEVISRIPGVKIAENGQISYNNKIISHLYLNGVDLLEGRYNIATRGIPADAVEAIDIIKRHNHARIDKGRTDSDNVAFNLKIKKDHSLIFGSGKADAGLPLLTAKVEATPIYLQDNFQDIASVKANNIGESLESNGVNLTRDNRDFSELEINPSRILNAPNTNGTSISNRYWLDNNSLALTNDALIKTTDDLILKAGVNYTYNDNELQSSTEQVFFFGLDSTVVNSSSKNRLRNNAYYFGLVQEVNKKKLYLKNKTTINGERATGFANVVQNENPLDYIYNRATTGIKNTTEFKTTVKDRIINSGVLIEYVENEERNEVIPIVFSTEIPSTGNPSKTNQTVNTSRLSLGAYSAYDFKIGKSKSQIKQSINWNTDLLNSNLSQFVDETDDLLPFPFVSDFKLNTFKSLTSFKSTIEFKDLTIILNPELNYINLKEQELLSNDLNGHSNYLFLQPSTSFNYKINYKWNTSLSGNYIGSVSNFSELFNSVILRNYNSLYRNPNEVNVTRTVFGTLYFGYSNILQGVLFSNSTTLSSSESDFILSSSIDDNGLVQIEAVNEPNKRSNFSNRTNFTKRFFKIIKTDLNYTFSSVRVDQIFNTIAQQTNAFNHSVDIDISIDNNTWYGLRYKGLANFGRTTSNGFKNSNTFLKHNLELDFYTSSKTRINLGTESVFTSFSSSDMDNRNTLFNAEFYYKPSKKLFLRASFSNIFNEQFFNTVQNNANFVSQSQFSLRPRQFTIGLNFSF